MFIFDLLVQVPFVDLGENLDEGKDYDAQLMFLEKLTNGGQVVIVVEIAKGLNREALQEVAYRRL